MRFRPSITLGREGETAESGDGRVVESPRFYDEGRRKRKNKKKKRKAEDGRREAEDGRRKTGGGRREAGDGRRRAGRGGRSREEQRRTGKSLLKTQHAFSFIS